MFLLVLISFDLDDVGLSDEAVEEEGGVGEEQQQAGELDQGHEDPVGQHAQDGDRLVVGYNTQPEKRE